MKENNADLYTMKLHDFFEIDNHLSASRVPGGWIYTTWVRIDHGDWRTSSVFVPYDEEFKGGE